MSDATTTPFNPAALDALLLAHLTAAASGDRDAYGRIVAACQNTITAIALAITRDVPASQDIAQEAFISAWQNLQRLQNPASFLPWLRQITRNLAHDHLRGRQRGAGEVVDAEAVIAMAADPQPGPFEQLLADEQHTVAAELISALPDDSREALLLYYREGQSSQQVARLLGLSDAAARKRLSRARASLRADLLARFAGFARDSAPAAAFTSMVATALAAASPPVAAAGIFTGTSAVIGAKTLGKILLGSAGSIGLGIVAAFAGLYLGLRSQLRGAIDETERLALIRSSVVSGLASVGFVAILLVIASVDDGWMLPVAATAAFMAILFHQTLVVQPRILSRRHAREAAADPIAAAAKRRRERLTCWVGLTFGLVGGFGGLLYGLVLSGRL